MEVSATLISNVTEAIIDEVRQWQARLLELVYPIVYVDCLGINVRGTVFSFMVLFITSKHTFSLPFILMMKYNFLTL